MQTVYLSRRNLETLLEKLNAKKLGEHSHCTIIKRDTEHHRYPCSDVTAVVAVENEVYYTERAPGGTARSIEHASNGGW